MIRNRLFAIVFTIAALIVGSLSAGVTTVAYASADVVVTATVKNHPDNGHGSPSHWADDNFNRTMTLHNNGDGSYTATTEDVGTFTTRVGSGSPNAGQAISRSLTGQMTGLSHGKITGELDPNYLDHNGKTFDDKNGSPFKSNDFFLAFFKPGATGGPFDTDYKFVYKTLDEQWIDANDNNDGTDDAAGDITGKLSSKLTVTGVCRNKTIAKWVVKNVQGDRARSFAYWAWVSPGKWTPTAHSNVAAASSVALTTPRASSVAIHSYNGYGVLVTAYAKAGTKAC